MTRTIRCGKWAVGVLLLVSASVAAAEVGSRPYAGLLQEPVLPQSGSLLLRMRAGYAVATRLDTEIHVSVSGPIARTTVRQQFRNDGTDWVEGIYVFPLPGDAAVDRLRMRIGERFIEGEIREKERARKEYAAAKAAGKRTGLVEQQRANLFTTSLANLAPGATVVIEIEYLETLDYDDGAFSMRIPTTLTPRYIPGAPLPDRQGSGWSADTAEVPDASLITPPVVTRSSHHRLTLHAEIDAGVPLESVVSRYHPITVTPDGGVYRVELSGAQAKLDHDIELRWKPVAAGAPRATLISETVGGDTHYLLMILPPTDAAAAPRMPRELVFIIDTSGSMYGTSLEQAKSALLLALGDLVPADRFNVIQFNSVTHALFGRSVGATAENIRAARDYVSGLVSNGGTEMRPALELALSEPPVETHLKQIVFITDGAVGNEAALYSLIASQLGAARLFTVGIGSAPNGWFMEKAAELGRGTATFISALHEVDEKMGRLFAKLARPQVTGIRVEWPGQQAVAYPAVVPDLYAGEPIVVTARLPEPPRDGDLLRISGHSTTGGWSTELPLRGTRTRPGVAALWARSRIADLLDQERRGGDAAPIRAAVVETALTHHLVSKYTSLVAVDKTPARPDAAALAREQVPNLLPYGQSHRAIFGFPATATGWQSRVAAGLVLILLAWLLWAFIRRLQQGVAFDVPATR
ncbi:MAG TPA: marine proteobacterial sortase target protein [Woeseiaceae bacterium]|nr:marine proteobacterial sortase target protein [Woeseiaceae bacterium]